MVATGPVCGAGAEAGISHRAPCRTAHRTVHCTRCPRCHGATVRHTRYLPTILCYLPPQVVVQVNGIDTPTVGEVVDVVSAQASPATAKLLPHTLLARSTCMASLVVDYRPAHLTEEPVHTPRLPLRGLTGARMHITMPGHVT